MVVKLGLETKFGQELNGHFFLNFTIVLSNFAQKASKRHNVCRYVFKLVQQKIFMYVENTSALSPIFLTF